MTRDTGGPKNSKKTGGPKMTWDTGGSKNDLGYWRSQKGLRKLEVQK